MHLVVPRHRGVEAIHDRVEFAAADLVRYFERDHIVRAVDPVEHGHFSCPADTHRLGTSFHPMSDLNMGLGSPGEGPVLSFWTSVSGFWLFIPSPFAIPTPLHFSFLRR